MSLQSDAKLLPDMNTPRLTQHPPCLLNARTTLAMQKLAFVFLAIPIAATAAPPWSAFNDFYAGMPKAEAKSAGYTNCRQSDGHGSSSDSIICDIPGDKRALGSLTASTATLEFKSHDLNTVKEIRLTFEAKTDAVLGQLTARYGKPEVGGSYYTWHRNGPDTIELFNRQRTSTAYVTMRYDKSMGEARAKHAREEAKRQATLKGF